MSVARALNSNVSKHTSCDSAAGKTGLAAPYTLTAAYDASVGASLQETSANFETFFSKDAACAINSCQVLAQGCVNSLTAEQVGLLSVGVSAVSYKLSTGRGTAAGYSFNFCFKCTVGTAQKVLSHECTATQTAKPPADSCDANTPTKRTAYTKAPHDPYYLKEINYVSSSGTALALDQSASFFFNFDASLCPIHECQLR